MKLVVPLTIPKTLEISVAPKLSCITRTIGSTPATAASKRICTPASRATSKSSSPCRASSCLLAVTTGLPARSAARTCSRAGSVPPISSTIRSAPARTSSKSPSPRVRTPEISGRRPQAASTAAARSATISAKAPPTVPRPSSPMRTGFETSSDIARRQVLIGLAPDHDPRIAVAAEDDGRPRDGVVVARHRVAVGAGRRNDDDVADPGVLEARLLDQDVAGLAMHADQAAGGRVADPVGDLGFVDGVVEHRANVVCHAAVDRHVAAAAG